VWPRYLCRVGRRKEQSVCEMATLLVTHLITLPRWFALPAAASGVLLGVALGGAWGWQAGMAVLAGVLVMAAAHSWNSFHDYAITKFDVGETGGRSSEKAYTAGQSVIAEGLLSERAVLLNALAWVGLSALPTAVLAVTATPTVWVPWALAILCAPWYSQAKKAWHPELPLGFGFATCAVWLGMATAGDIDWRLGALASIPFFLAFGVVAELIDQHADYQSDWPKGGRSLGLLTAHLGLPLAPIVAVGMVVVFASQAALVVGGALDRWSLLSFAGAIPLFWSVWFIELDFKKGVLWGLGGGALYQLLFVVGEAIGGGSMKRIEQDLNRELDRMTDRLLVRVAVSCSAIGFVVGLGAGVLIWG